MTRTMLRVALFLFGLCGTLTAGAHKDYEVCVGNSERRLEDASQQHILGDPIYYEAATGFYATDDEPQQETSAAASQTESSKPITEDKLISSPTPEVRLDDAEKTDPRVEQVRLFFEKYKSPAAKYAKLFVTVADENNLDWYLLPSIAFIESGGGKAYRNNNIFGWDSGKHKFSSIEQGIRYVGHAMTVGPYANKNTLQKLRVYNTYVHYQVVAKKVMMWIKTAPRT